MLLSGIFDDLNLDAIQESGIPLQEVLVSRLAKASDKLQASTDDDPLQIAELQLHLGRSLGSLGAFVKAHSVLLHTYNVRTASFGRSDPRSLESLMAIADLNLTTGHLEEAIAQYNDGLPVWREKFGDDSAEVMIVTSNLAQALGSIGQSRVALDVLLPVLEQGTGRLGADHSLVRSTLNRVAVLYLDVGEVERAAEIYEKLMADVGETFTTPEEVSVANNLAATYWRMERLDRSIPLFEKVVRHQRKTAGPRNISTLKTIANLASDGITDGGHFPFRLDQNHVGAFKC